MDLKKDDFLAWWEAFEVNYRKALLERAMTDKEPLLALLRAGFEAGRLDGEQLQELRRLRAEAGIVLPAESHHHRGYSFILEKDKNCLADSDGLLGAAKAKYVAALLNAAPKLLGEE